MSTFDPFSVPNGTTNGGGTTNGMDTLNRLVVDGNYIDGSWELCVYVEDIKSYVTVRVLGDLPLGGLMHRVVENVKFQQSWSDHAIWWADRNCWLLHNRTTLDQYGIQSDAKLMFRRMHNDLQIVLPSLNTVVLRVNYASRLFSVVRNICKELNIRHSEELSLTFPVTKDMLKTNCPLPSVRHGFRKSGAPTNPRSDQIPMKAKMPSTPTSNYNLGTDPQPSPGTPYATLGSHLGTMQRFKSDNSLDQERFDFARYADCALRRSAKAVFADSWLMKPKNLVQKARLNSGWLDSSRSLLEQGIEPAPQNPNGQPNSTTPPTLYLCFKYYAFYDLNIKYDAVRIHQLYEQARWSILSGQFDCTEDEMVVFAAYQLQAELQSTAANQAALNSPLLGTPDSVSVNPYSTLGAYHTLGSNVSRSPAHPVSTLDGNGKQYMSSGSIYYCGVDSLPRYPNSSPYANSNILNGSSVGRHQTDGRVLDEVDELLCELEQSCGVADEPGSATRTLKTRSNMGSITGTVRSSVRNYDSIDTAEIPSLEDTLKVFKDRTLLFKRYRALWVVIREARLYLYKTQTDRHQPLGEYSLRDCTVVPDVSTANQKFIIKLSVLTEPKPMNGSQMNGNPTPMGTLKDVANIREDIWLRFDSDEQYAKWLAACRLGSRGKTLASRVAYEKEVDATLELLRLQTPGPAPAISAAESVKYLGDLTDFCPERLIRKARSKDALRLRITEAHVNIRDLGLLEAKFKYIQAWQRLNGFGRSYFVVSFDRNSSSSTILPNPSSGGLFSTPMDDLIAISPGRVEIVSPQTGEVLKAWNFSDLRSWNVNWDAGKVILECRNGQVSFRPLSTNCKTIVEFIGGYVFLSQRNPEKSQEVNERQFHRLTGVTE